MSGWASLPSVPDAEHDDTDSTEHEQSVAGTESEPAADTADLHDPRNRDNWRVENWRVT